MELLNERAGIDFYVDPRPLTNDDKAAFSDYIKADKSKRCKLPGVKMRVQNKSIYKECPNAPTIAQLRANTLK